MIVKALSSARIICKVSTVIEDNDGTGNRGTQKQNPMNRRGGGQSLIEPGVI